MKDEFYAHSRNGKPPEEWHRLEDHFKKVADWISEQVWYSGQQIYPNEDGSICLKFPVADFSEIRREILKYGANVEVLSPQKLREEIKSEIEKMANFYKKNI
jgi:predicted DNA-binding transcriptional regulator YafY